MKLRILVNVFAVVGIAGSMSVITGQKNHLPTSFVQGEVVVKFSSKSKAAESMATIQGTNKPGEALSAYVSSLSSKLGLPIKAKSVGSGGSIILEIDRSKLVSRWVDQLRADVSIKDVRALSSEGLDSSSPLVLQLVLDAGSPEEKMVAKLAAEGRETGPELQVINGRLRRELDCPVTTRVLHSNQLEVTPDYTWITLEVAKRLAKRPDVEYAQPNFLRSPIGSTDQISPQNR